MHVGEKNIVITVRRANVGAIRLYQRVGYAHAGGIGEGFFLLKKELRPASEVAA
jgi:ribosomal protein S18 acetylase RimI-like enzyme